MPELPEVTRIAVGLNTRLQNSKILDVKIHSGRYSRHGWPEGLKDFVSDLPVVVTEVTSKGKFILIKTENDSRTWWIWNTLGMSGSWKVEKSKHSHVEFISDKGSTYFEDMRNFGTLKFTNSKEETEKKLKTIGPDHLHEEITDKRFQEILSCKGTYTLAKALMDQKLIGGIGNYIKAEALYRAKLSPNRKIESLTGEDFKRLNSAIKEVVVASYQNGGATIKTYSGINNEKGKYPFSFLVYGKKICPLGFEVKRETTEDGRTTHWVEEVQK